MVRYPAATSPRTFPAAARGKCSRPAVRVQGAGWSGNSRLSSPLLAQASTAFSSARGPGPLPGERPPAGIGQQRDHVTGPGRSTGRSAGESSARRTARCASTRARRCPLFRRAFPPSRRHTVSLSCIAARSGSRRAHPRMCSRQRDGQLRGSQRSAYRRLEIPVSASVPIRSLDKSAASSTLRSPGTAAVRWPGPPIRPVDLEATQIRSAAPGGDRQHAPPFRSASSWRGPRNGSSVRLPPTRRLHRDTAGGSQARPARAVTCPLDQPAS